MGHVANTVEMQNRLEFCWQTSKKYGLGDLSVVRTTLKVVLLKYGVKVKNGFN